MLFIEWLKEAINEVRSDPKKLAVRKGRFVVARQNPQTTSIWASMVRRGLIKSRDIVWVFEDLKYRRDWIALFDFVHKKVHVLNKQKWPKVKLKKNWIVTNEKPDPKIFMEKTK